MTRPKVLLAGPPADAHTWNLIYLELLLQENGFCVTNLGPNVAHALLFETLTQKPHDLVVMSCLNGSVKQEGLALMEERSSRTRGGEIFVIGGALQEQEDINGTQRALMQAGFLDAFLNESDPSRFVRFLSYFKEGRCGILTS